MGDGEAEREMLFRWLLSEQETTSKQFAGYLGADQKIIAVMATVVVGIVGLATVKIADIDRSSIPYVIFLAAFLMSLAINQSFLYSSLILFCIERRYDLAVTMGKVLNCEPDIALTHKSFANYRSINSYSSSVKPYYAFKMSIGVILSVAGLIYGLQAHHSWWLYISFIVSLGFSTAAVFVVLSNARDQAEFQLYSESSRKEEFKERRKIRREEEKNKKKNNDFTDKETPLPPS